MNICVTKTHTRPMLHSWLMLRQVRAALKAGRLEDAWHLLRSPGLKRTDQAKEYLLEAGIGFLGRAKKLARENKLSAALKDLGRAREAGVEQSTIDMVKSEMMDQSLVSVREALESSKPGQALNVIESLRQQGVPAAQLGPLEETARAWIAAKEEAQRGEFGRAVATLEQVAFRPFAAMVDQHSQWQRDKQAFQQKCDALHDAVGRQAWRQAVKLADELLALAPEHAEVRKARSKAWRALEPPTLPHHPPQRSAEPEASSPSEEEAPRRLLCWVDGVGGYLLCLTPRVSLGRATGDATVDIPLFADVSRLHAYLNRDSEGGYVLEAVRPVQVNGKPVQKALLKDGDELTLGSACKLKFRQPLAVSGTARLDLISRHRLPLSVDAVLLMADACLLGDNADTHVTVPGLKRPLALVRHHEGIAAQCAGPFEVDGQPCKGRAPLTPRSTVQMDEARVSLEPVGPRFMGSGSSELRVKG
jgi:hypothetical protein